MTVSNTFCPVADNSAATEAKEKLSGDLELLLF